MKDKDYINTSNKPRSSLKKAINFPHFIILQL